MTDPNDLDQIRIREKKLAALRTQGIDPYPAAAERSTTIGGLLAAFPAGAVAGALVSVVGRIRALRLHGGSCFGHLADASGAIQFFLKRDQLGPAYDDWIARLDVGDFLELHGPTMRTNRGEPTVLVQRIRLLAKSLRPLPEKWHGVSAVELRYRRRELDLIANPSVRGIFERRAKLIRALRRFLDDHGFLEVETPILQPVAGGTIARPFVTRHATLKHDFFLRIAPELYLKRLVVGGFERVYEIGRCFRNEGIDHAHNPEFTMAEFYVAYADYRWLMEFTETCLSAIVPAVTGDLVIAYEKKTVDFSPPYPRLRYATALRGAGVPTDATLASLRAFMKAKRLDIPAHADRGKLLDECLKTLVLPTLIRPTFLTDHPIALSPLAKQHPEAPETVQRFQLIAAGLELVNAYSELNDPEEQRQRFAQSRERRQQGDVEAHPYDADFLASLETGLPPTAGWGMGIDRLAMVLNDVHTIKEVLLFPTLKPKNH